MSNIDKKEELTETLFKLIEDIGHTEELIEEMKKETHLIRDTIKQDIELIQEKLEQQSKAIIAENLENSDGDSAFKEINQKIDRLNNEIQNLKKLKSNSIDINELINLDDATAQKVILKKEIKRWQTMIVGILSAFLVFSIGFFIFSGRLSMEMAIVYIGFSMPFCIAIYSINNNLKKINSQKNAIKQK